MRRSFLISAALLATLGLGMAACKKVDAPAASAAAVQTYPVTGVVKGFQSENKVIILQHEKIEGLMEAMTMGFELQDPALAKGLKVGDKVSGTLSVSADAYVISALSKK